MSLEKTIKPYEILIRFSPDGEISGAHFKQIETVKDGEEILAQKETVAEAIEIGGTKFNELLNIN